jgi:DeoR family suf operon transcriptional repressor
MGSTRECILRTLHVQGKCTIRDLAQAAGISPISVRHHIANLLADGLLEVEENHHGVGRPHHLYSLSEKGIERFPRRYYHLTIRLLEELKDVLPEDEIEGVFSNIASSMADKYAHLLERLPLEKRIDDLHRLLAEEGFEAIICREGNQVVIKEVCCPFFPLGREHPEVCLIDKFLIAKALSIPVERVKHMRQGNQECAFEIRLKSREMKATKNG